MRIVTGPQMAEIDRRAIAEVGIPAEALMELAGVHVARAAWEVLDQRPPSVGGPGSPVGRGVRPGPRVVVVAGRGNNGGDGFVAARHLANWGARVRVYTLAEARRRAADREAEATTGGPRNLAARQLEVLRRLGMDITPVAAADLSKVKLNLAMADVVIDALLGTGFHGQPEGLVAQLIDAINEAGAPVVAVDVPSGVDSSGGPVTRAVRAHTTISFGWPKVGTVLYPGADYCGRLHVVDIGFPRRLAEEGADMWWLQREMVREWLPERPANSHKGVYGHVLVMAGSADMSGAGQLTVRGAHRAGAGLVTWALPATLRPLLAPMVPETMTLAWPDDAALAEREAGELVERWLERRISAVVVGPGLGQGQGPEAFARALVARSGVPAVIDADALHMVARWEDAPGWRQGDSVPEWVLTPHPGEMARLCQRPMEEVLAAPASFARTVAARYRAVVVLKGARTVVAAPDGRVWVNSTGNPILAAGGTGDVLAGVIGAFLAQGRPAWQAAAAGVYLHGLAGDKAFAELGASGALAREVADRLPGARREVVGDEEDIPATHRLNG